MAGAYVIQLIVYDFELESAPAQIAITTDGECGECKGRVIDLTLQYDDNQTAQVMVEQKNGDIVFDASVGPGQQFSFSGTDGSDNTFGTEIRIYVEGVKDTKIHTSCSQPIGPGLISGDFTVIEGCSKDGGLLCPL